MEFSRIFYWEISDVEFSGLFLLRRYQLLGLFYRLRSEGKMSPEEFFYCSRRKLAQAVCIPDRSFRKRITLSALRRSFFWIFSCVA